jgi:predicted anti-sigma-YlaC factor YlaD
VSLIPRWQFMTDEAKALTKRTAVSVLVALAVLLLFRALLPWVVLGLIAWWIWKAISK